jgi:hypothetical protein
MYTYLWRSSPYPSLSVFDFPDANVACTRRIRSNTPLQSLSLANDEVLIDLARGVAQRVTTSTATEDRVDYVFQLCLARLPNDIERAHLQSYFEGQRIEYAAAPEAAAQLAGLTDLSPEATADRAAWVAAARVLMNLDEFITRE